MLNIYNKKYNSHDDAAVVDQPMEKKTTHGDYQKYVDPSGELTTGKFKFGVWLVANKVRLYKAGLITLVILSAIFWLYSIYGWALYFVGWQANTQLQQNLSRFPNYTPAQSHFAPQQLQISMVNIFAGCSNRYDIVADVVNPNPRFYVGFDYYFVIGADKTAKQHTFLLPDEQRPVVSFGYTNGYPNGASLVLENISWQRIDSHRVVDVDSWQKLRLDFLVSDFTFTSRQAQSSADANIVQFKLKNNTPFGYHDAQFVVGFYQNGSMVGVTPLHLLDYNSSEIKTVDLRNYTDTLSASDVALFPVIDIYDSAVYLSP